MANLIEVVNVYKSFNGLQILNGVTFSLREGEILCILGPSGCGKTTLFRLIAGLLQPDQGTARCNTSYGYVFQDLRLLPWLTVKQNVGLPFRLRRQHVQQEKIHALLSSLGLEEYTDYPIEELSGGMQQRVAIARAVVLDPQVLLLDEPFRGLGLLSRESIENDVLKIYEKSQKSILMVSHEIEEAVRLADRMIILSDKPTTISGIMEVPRRDIPKPRDIYSDEFTELKREVYRFLRP